MARFILLDAGVVGLLCSSPAVPDATACYSWLLRQGLSGSLPVIPNRTDFEVRRESLRVGASSQERRLEELRGTIRPVPVNSELAEGGGLAMSRISFVAACVAASIIAATSAAADSEPLVSLFIAKASAEPFGQEILVACEATIENSTGRDLTVRSGYFSAFDGLEVVVTNREGQVLAQQAYIDHQSVFTLKGQDFPLKQGRTVEDLRFPISKLPKGIQSLRVRLVGTLPGSGYKRILSSETLAVEIKKGADR